MTEPPRPYYNSEAIRRKREAERAALLARVKQALGFGMCQVKYPNDAAMDSVRQFKQQRAGILDRRPEG